jgi:hypothetical protein
MLNGGLKPLPCDAQPGNGSVRVMMPLLASSSPPRSNQIQRRPERGKRCQPSAQAQRGDLHAAPEVPEESPSQLAKLLDQPHFRAHHRNFHVPVIAPLTSAHIFVSTDWSLEFKYIGYAFVTADSNIARP